MSTKPIFSRVLRLLGFRIALVTCSLFVVLTSVAMFMYPGGTLIDKTTIGYSFSNNFFSELGMTQFYSGQPNYGPFLLFVVALSGAGLGMIVFFIAYAPFFTRSIIDRLLAWLGTLVGITSGMCFIGVALTPADANRSLHANYVLWAFQTFFIAVLLYLPPLFRERRHPKPSASVFGVFAFLLAAYVLLINFGPAANTPEGLTIQATGQKIIAYACVASIILESLGAIRFIKKSGRT